MMNTQAQSKGAETKNAVVIHSTIFRLVETIEKKIKAGHTEKDLEELRLLREQCGSDNPLVSVTACQGLVHLVKSFVFPLPNTVSALVASLFSVKSVTGVTSALTDLLILEFKCQLASEPTYTCPYNSSSPQHPLVSVLKRRPQAWRDVLNQVSTICTCSDKQVQNYSLELVKPVLMVVLMEKNDLPNDSRQQGFRIVINHFSDKDFLVQALASCLWWDSSQVLEAVQLVSSLAQAAVASKHGQLVSLSCLALVCLLPRLLQASLSPQPALQLLTQLAVTATNTHSTLLALLADSIPTCPANYLHHLLDFIVELLGRGQCSLDCTWMCVSALLPWLSTNSSHLHKALHTATLIVNHATAATANASTTANLISNRAAAILMSADSKLTQAIHIARLSEELRGDSQATVKWLQQLGAVELDPVHYYVSALLIGRSDAAEREAALCALVSSRAPSAMAHMLPLLLYQLARERQSHLQLALLRALPATAVDKGNVLGVVSTLQAVSCSGQPTLSLLAVELYCQLWLSQERCYPQLMTVLHQDGCKHQEPWLAHLLQASICKTICDTKPEMHGKEVVAKVSEILNKCGSVKESAASALALEALVPLCRHDVVDVFTIWRSLAPRFSRDKRPLVIRSLCELVSVAAVQKSSLADADDTPAQMFRWLWNLVATSKQPTVVDDSLKALSKFRLDQMNLKMLPECFRKGLKLPPEMAKTPVDAARKPEDVLEYIPGECWVQMLKHVGTESASQALASWIKMEVISFRGASLYQVDRQEPSSYSHLPHRSVVRGVTTSLQHLCETAATSADDARCANLCVAALLQPSPKPLPSLSWAFLSDFVLSETDTSLSQNSARLAAKQSQISPSARNITEALITKSSNDQDKIEFLYSILTDLCRGIPPNTLRPFLERTLQSALNKKDNNHFTNLLRHIKTTLKEEKIHDANRTLLNQQVKALWGLIEPQNEMLGEFFSCVSELPVSMIESMSSTSLMWEVTSAHLQKAFRLRAFMALVPAAPQPLNWLNEIIEAANNNIAEQALALQLVEDTMHQLSRHNTTWSWLQELMGQTHSISVNKKEQAGVEFLVAVFVLCVDIMSGYCSIATNHDSRALRFPQAVKSLVTQNGDANSMLEWLNHMQSVESFPSEYTNQFELATRNISVLIA